MADSDLDSFRREARAWIESNLERREQVTRRAARTENMPPEVIAASRALQRKLFDAGWAGLSYP